MGSTSCSPSSFSVVGGTRTCRSGGSYAGSGAGSGPTGIVFEISHQHLLFLCDDWGFGPGNLGAEGLMLLLLR